VSVSAGLRAVVLTYGFGQEHVPLVERLVADGCPPPAILLVHNPARPGDPWTPERPSDVPVHLMPRNAGYAGGMNEGVRRQLAAGADRLLLLTHDVRPEPGMVAELERALSADERLGIVGPLLIEATDREVWSAGVERSGGTVRHRTDIGPLEGHGVRLADGIDGTVMLVRAQVAREAGGFDERFFMYFEESDFCLRAGGLGWRVGVAAGARAATQPGKSKRHAAHAYFLTRNGLEYARRAEGGRGIADAFVEVARRSWWALPKPGRGQCGEERAVGIQRLVGTALGLVHFIARRWGPPPGYVLRMSDIAGTGTWPATRPPK
jgi:GT2 family glycosyltransferase